MAANFGLTRAGSACSRASSPAASRLLLVLAALVLIIGPWEVSAADFLDTLRKFAFGFRIGDLTISFSAIFSAAVILVVALIVTRALQELARAAASCRAPSSSPSLQHSIAAIFGYVGVIAAIVLALSQLGIDLQKVALIAGALSVGIGFGLQSIVSNFVSGLILLAERPIRVGDLIVVKGEEGYVRRIRVRATEIETFERASVIIPNAEFITGAVKNWTHANTTGRIIVKVGVGYDSDADAGARHPARLRATSIRGCSRRRRRARCCSASATARSNSSCAACRGPCRCRSWSRAAISTSRSCAGFARPGSRSPTRSARCGSSATAARPIAAAAGAYEATAGTGVTFTLWSLFRAATSAATGGQKTRMISTAVRPHGAVLRRPRGAGARRPRRLCGRPGADGSQPSFYRSLAEAGAELDAAAAASMISGYRQNNGLTTVTRRSRADEARAGAGAGHGGAQQDRPRRHPAPSTPGSTRRGIDAQVAAENIGPATTPWPRPSPAGAIPRRTAPTCCSSGATRMGIAAVYAPKSKYKVFWALILAAPDGARG